MTRASGSCRPVLPVPPSVAQKYIPPRRARTGGRTQDATPGLEPSPGRRFGAVPDVTGDCRASSPRPPPPPPLLVPARCADSQDSVPRDGWQRETRRPALACQGRSELTRVGSKLSGTLPKTGGPPPCTGLGKGLVLFITVLDAPGHPHDCCAGTVLGQATVRLLCPHAQQARPCGTPLRTVCELSATDPWINSVSFANCLTCQVSATVCQPLTDHSFAWGLRPAFVPTSSRLRPRRDAASSSCRGAPSAPPRRQPYFLEDGRQTGAPSAAVRSCRVVCSVLIPPSPSPPSSFPFHPISFLLSVTADLHKHTTPCPEEGVPGEGRSVVRDTLS